VVQTIEDLQHDPQLKEREFLLMLRHPVIGVFGHLAPPFKLLNTKAQVRTSPCLGEHTEYVCTEFLAMSHEEFAELSQQGVFK
jgi:formyl-CoA transferase